MVSHAPRVPIIHAGDLSPARRAAYGRWVGAVWGLVEHVDHCPFGCTAAQPRCSAGEAALDAEQVYWQSWRAAR